MQQAATSNSFCYHTKRKNTMATLGANGEEKPVVTLDEFQTPNSDLIRHILKEKLH